MATLSVVNFTPSTTTAFTFQASLNGVPYNVTVYWNTFGQRYYVQVADMSGNVIVFRPMTSSGPSYQATFDWADGVATATTASPHNVPIGQLALLLATGTGDVFDTTAQMLSTSITTLTYAVDSTPTVTLPAPGAVSFAQNLLYGYNIGTLFYNAATQQIFYY